MGNLSTPISVQKLQMALHAKAKTEAGYRFYALYDKIYRDDILVLTAVEIRAKLVVRVFREQEMLCGCDVAQPRSRVNGRLRPYAAWRSEPLTRRRGDTLRHGSKRGSLALTAMETSAFHPQKDADFHPRQQKLLDHIRLAVG